MADKDMKKKGGQEAGYAEHIEHVQATRPEPWPGIKGRSHEHEEELPTGTKREDQAKVTDAQRKLEDAVDETLKRE